MPSTTPTQLVQRPCSRAEHGAPRRQVTFQSVASQTGQSRLQRQALRISRFQEQWQNIKSDLPPQLSRRHIGMISIGGVIGTGLFLGSGAALKSGGPVGALIGYSIIGTVVYALCVSVGEMIAFLPNVGGVVGLADLYVDPALGFSLGWAAWYNWSITLPAEVAAAAIVVQFWDQARHISPRVWSGIFLSLAIAVNCFSSRVYGEFEFWLSTMKVVAIVFLTLVCVILDLGAGNEGFIGFSNWKAQPFGNYFDIPGGVGRFLGFLAVLMQASFSFFGSEVPGIAAGEVIDASRNVPRALRRVWIRITMFYVIGIFVTGLVVPANDPQLIGQGKTSSSSPFVIALKRAGIKGLPHFVNAMVLLSAWSAAASDVYISSRFMFFLARRGHAPQFLAYLLRYPYSPPSHPREDDISDVDSDEDDTSPPESELQEQVTHNLDDNGRRQDLLPNSRSNDSIFGRSLDLTPDIDFSLNTQFMVSHDPSRWGAEETITVGQNETASRTPRAFQGDIEEGGEQSQKEPFFVLPLNAVVASASIGLFSFLGSVNQSESESGRGNTAEDVFSWLVAAASVASMQSWIGVLFTYIRWHQGTTYAEQKHKPSRDDDPHSHEVLEQIEKIREHRHRGQPYLAWYAFGVCVLVMVTNGWSAFLYPVWRIADVPQSMNQTQCDSLRANGNMSQHDIFSGLQKYRCTDPQLQQQASSVFLSSYVPIVVFVLLTLGYKLIYRTRMYSLEEMTFDRRNVPEPEQPLPATKSRREDILRWFLLL
ncbi:amino acid permease-domain-containing protein [Cristinia sonorae]|uniref:Amino acid permease-domain-containing protein n=1 Tax=Cristinia sonorae TaxID=1940300 RepID=A0A8K0XQQ3_9AGAR|nr:amino acid permease-domain-containing protein [Cristinia sonorae]